ncbi:PKD family protein [Sphingobacterium yanglingense]|uniref:PKD family protein n=2 Tax=Sphingobacterium yanglingense TaxID=1437280 RepID=A0A4R6WGD6_9SPHI|nr:PKD family protein [Sphingobacterium yanglingense]
MKKTTCYIYFLLLAGTILFPMCKKDNGNYNYIELPAFSIDTTGVGRVSVEQNATLALAPKITFKGDHGTLSFLWRIYLASGRGVIDTLSTADKLEETIANAPGSYFIELQVKEPKNGITALAVYNLTVQEQDAVPSGWLVFENKDGILDLSLVSSNTFISGSNVPELVYRDLLYTRNLENLSGTARQIQRKNSEIILLTTDDMLAVSASTFKINRHFNQFFFNASDAPFVKDAKSYINNGKAFVNGTDVYRGSGNFFNSKIISPDSKGYEAAPYLIAGSYNDFFYDQLNGRYILMSEGSIVGRPFTKKGDLSLFSPENTGRKMLLGGQGYPIVSDYYEELVLSSWGIFTDKVETDRRYLMILNEDNGALANVDVSSAANIRVADLFSVGNLNSFALYSDGQTIRKIQVDMVKGTTAIFGDAGFISPGQEVITAMEIYKPTNQFLFVATWNELTKEGKLYLVQMNEVSGDLTEIVKVWTGFGKIEAMGSKIN